MRMPTIHANGTPQSELRHQLELAGRSLETSIECPKDAAPVIRDCYPQGPAAFGDAEKEHADRVVKLIEVLDELLELKKYVAGVVL